MSKRPQYTYLIVLPSYNYIFRTLFAKLLNTHYTKKKGGGERERKKRDFSELYHITQDCYASKLCSSSRVTQLCSRHPGFHLAPEVAQPCEKKTLCSSVLCFSSTAAAWVGRCLLWAARLAAGAPGATNAHP